MKNIPTNQVCFKISQENLEPHLDSNYFLVEKHPELKKYVRNVSDIKEILITLKRLKKCRERKSVIDKYYEELFCLFEEKFSNCSELGCFVNACDTTRDLAQKDFDSFKYITNLYIKKRILDERVPENWVQAILDSNSSRRKGVLGEQKLIKILQSKKFTEVNDWDNFEKNGKSVMRFSKEVVSIEKVRENLDIELKLKKQDKRLDLIIKDGKNIFILEAKHLNVGGGEQDKQISELIEILSLKREKKNLFNISFLDGTYSNLLLGIIGKRSKKKLKQRKEIEKYLKNNSNNYWVNTAGFKKLFGFR